MSGSDNPEQPPSRYASARDEALHLMSQEGWASESSGDVAGPAGWFARVSNSADELAEVADAFEDDLQTLGVEPAQLLGHFLLQETAEDGFNVEEYPNAVSANLSYVMLVGIHQKWLARDD